MSDQELLDKIDAYLQGSLPAVEVVSFEAEMRANPELAATVEAQRTAHEALDHLFVAQMKEKAARWRAEAEGIEGQKPTPDNTKGQWFFRWRLIPVVVLLLVGWLAFWTWQKFQEHDDGTSINDGLTPKLAPLKPPSLTAEAADSLLRLQQWQEAARLRRDSLDRLFRQDSLDRLQRKSLIYATLAQNEWDKNAAAYGELGRASAIRGSAAASKADSLLRLAARAIDQRQYPKAQKLLESIGAENNTLYHAALDMLAYVYARRGYTGKAVATYQQYIRASENSDTELVEWTLLHYYLADYPRYKQQVKGLLEPMMANKNHQYDDFQADAVQLKAALVKTGWW